MNAGELLSKNKIPIIKILVTAESLILLYVAILPVPPTSGLPGIRPGDLDHLLSYFLYTLLLAGIYVKKENIRKELIQVVIVAANFSFFTEIIQLFVPERTFDPLDWGLNLLGIAIALILIFLISRRKEPY